ncbi:MAG: hypothetical protein RL641_2 [Candidatus Parcubacteria bacterium]|jgi:hypothetical protein
MKRNLSLLISCLCIILLGYVLEKCGLVTPRADELPNCIQNNLDTKFSHLADSCIKYAESRKTKGTHYTALEYALTTRYLDSLAHKMNQRIPELWLRDLRYIINDGSLLVHENIAQEMRSLRLPEWAQNSYEYIKLRFLILLGSIFFIGFSFLLSESIGKIMFRVVRTVRHLITYIKVIRQNDIVIATICTANRKWAVYRARAPSEFIGTNDKVPWMMF